MIILHVHAYLDMNSIVRLCRYNHKHIQLNVTRLYVHGYVKEWRIYMYHSMERVSYMSLKGCFPFIL